MKRAARALAAGARADEAAGAAGTDQATPPR